MNPGEDENNTESEINWWLAFCLDGSQGIDSVKIVNKLASKEPDFTHCENLYKDRKNLTISDEKNKATKVEVKKTSFLEFEFGENRNRKVNNFLKGINTNPRF